MSLWQCSLPNKIFVPWKKFSRSNWSQYPFRTPPCVFCPRRKPVSLNLVLGEHQMRSMLTGGVIVQRRPASVSRLRKWVKVWKAIPKVKFEVSYTTWWEIVKENNESVAINRSRCNPQLFSIFFLFSRFRISLCFWHPVDIHVIHNLNKLLFICLFKASSCRDWHAATVCNTAPCLVVILHGKVVTGGTWPLSAAKAFLVFFLFLFETSANLLISNAL